METRIKHTAKSMRRLAETFTDNEVQKILMLVHKHASKGEFTIDIDSLYITRVSTENELKRLGYEVVKTAGRTFLSKSYTISW